MHAGETFGTEDPRTGEVYTQVAEAQEADVDAAVKAAREVRFRFAACSHTPFLTNDVPFLIYMGLDQAAVQCFACCNDTTACTCLLCGRHLSRFLMSDRHLRCVLDMTFRQALKCVRSYKGTQQRA